MSKQQEFDEGAVRREMVQALNALRDKSGYEMRYAILYQQLVAHGCARQLRRRYRP